MRALAEALRLLSILPIPGKGPTKRSTVIAAFPWAGMVLGLLVAAGYGLAAWVFGAIGCGVTAVFLRVVLTGGLHLDGLADSADGFGGGRDREKILTIMADSRMGSFGSLALILVLLAESAILTEWTVSQGAVVAGRSAWPLSPSGYLPLILAPMMSRGVLPFLIRLFPSARKGGMGDRNRQDTNVGAVVFSLVSLFLAAWVLGSLSGVIAGVAVALVMSVTALVFFRRLGGLTGDVYGALIQIGDLVGLSAPLVLLRIPGLPPFLPPFL